MRPINVLRTEDADNILAICGGVPQQDYDFLKAKGVAAIYRPGTNIPKAAGEVLGRSGRGGKWRRSDREELAKFDGFEFEGGLRA